MNSLKNKVTEIIIGAFTAKVFEEIVVLLYPTSDILFKGLTSVIGGILAIITYEKLVVKSNEPLINQHTFNIIFALTYAIIFYHCFTYNLADENEKIPIVVHFGGFMTGLVLGGWLSVLLQEMGIWIHVLLFVLSMIASRLIFIVSDRPFEMKFFLAFSFFCHFVIVFAFLQKESN